MPDRVETAYAYEARLSSPAHSDTLVVYVYGQRLRMLSDGKVLDARGKVFLNFDFQLPLQELYYYQREHDFFLFYSKRGARNSVCKVKRINLTHKEVVWETEVEGAGITRPVIRGQFAYFSSIGFIGKLKLKNGAFDWKLGDLQRKGKYNRFREPEFLGANQILFVSPHPFSLQNDTILVNDVTGEILRMN